MVMVLLITANGIKSDVAIAVDDDHDDDDDDDDDDDEDSVDAGGDRFS